MVRHAIMWTGSVLAAAAALAWLISLTPAASPPGPVGGTLRLADGVVYWARGLIPLWAPITLGALVAWSGWRLGHEERQRAMEGRCLFCGYDLSGVTGPCPECGKEQQA